MQRVSEHGMACCDSDMRLGARIRWRDLGDGSVMPPPTQGAEPELLPCPFCGSAAEWTEHRPFFGASFSHAIRCVNCFAHVSAAGKNDAVAWWNRRRPAAQGAQGVEEPRYVQHLRTATLNKDELETITYIDALRARAGEMAEQIERQRNRIAQLDDGWDRAEAALAAAKPNAERWEAFCNLWAASTVLEARQDETGFWVIRQIEPAEEITFKPLVGEDPDATIDAARSAAEGKA